MNSKKLLPALFGIMFILSFLSYGAGSFLTAAVGLNGNIAVLSAERGSILSGGLMISVFHTMMNTGLLVVMFSLIRPSGPVLSRLYLVSGLLGTFLLAVGGVFLMLPLYLHGAAGAVFSGSTGFFYSVNFLLYQAGMFIWGCGGIFLCILLQRGRIFPAAAAFFGVAAYLVFITGTVLEICGVQVGTISSIPGGVFEIFLSVWMIIRGFRIQHPAGSAVFP